MAAYDLNVRSVPLLSGGGASSSMGDLAKFLQLGNQVEDRKLRVQQQRFIEGQGQRDKDDAVELNRSLADALNTTRTTAAENFTLDPGNLANLQANEGFQNLTRPLNAQEETKFLELQQQNPALTKADYSRNLAQGEHITGAMQSFQQNAPKFTDAKVFEQSMRDNLANTAATPEQIDAMVKREMGTAYDLMPEDIAKVQLAANTTPSLSGINKLFGTGSSKASTRTPNDSNAIASKKFAFEMQDRYNINAGDGRWYKDWFGIDPGRPDLDEVGVAKYTGFMSQLGYDDVSAMTALDAIREDDTTDVSLADLVSANPNGQTEADKALRKVMTQATANQSNENRSNGGIFSGQQASQLYAQQVAAQRQNNTNILSSMRGREATQEQRRNMLLGQFAPKTAPTAPPVVNNNTGTPPPVVTPPPEARQRPLLQEQAAVEPGPVARKLFGEKDDAILEKKEVKLLELQGTNSRTSNRKKAKLESEVAELERRKEFSLQAQIMDDATGGTIKLKDIEDEENSFVKLFKETSASLR